MSEFSRQIADGLSLAERNVQIANEKAIQDERLLTTCGAVQWKQLQSLLTQQCLDINAEPGLNGLLSWEDKPSEFIIVNNRNQREICLSFCGAAHSISVGRSIQYLFRVNGTSVYLSKPNRGMTEFTAISLERLSQEVLTNAAGL